jgi:DsbC/DsbD-like thiol-disulfide interchange protein
MDRRAFCFVLATVAAIGGLVLRLEPQLHAQKSETKVKIAARGSKPDADGKQTVTVSIQIDKGWHIYANPIGNDGLKSIQTVVTLAGKEKLQDVKIEYPAGKVHKDATLGDYKIYEDQVEIKAQVQRAKGDTSPLEASVKIQACDEKKCLLISTVNVPVE